MTACMSISCSVVMMIHHVSWGAVVLQTGNRGDGGSIPPIPPFRNLGNFVHPTFACIFWKSIVMFNSFFLSNLVTFIYHLIVMVP